jgi:hypothetical protein
LQATSEEHDDSRIQRERPVMTRVMSGLSRFRGSHREGDGRAPGHIARLGAFVFHSPPDNLPCRSPHPPLPPVLKTLTCRGRCTARCNWPGMFNLPPCNPV